ncbi:ABC transporter permease [Paenibacillus harenae]|uniref:ABC transport system permease protein n=1 Tax=Paenibacillus harenae TaxID=306543 RepID=A0ABT9U7F5_PAEHA|nr:FtsX-like permease family protein [Paenibacillus harenae]MDQ0115573.1 putative ABC transport system permease protein [Paenibacillus harenae]
MNIFKLSRKNVFESWRRSMSLGTFIFLATFLLLFFTSFISTMQNDLNQAISNSLSGDIQLRQGGTTEGDMLSLKGKWGQMAYLEQKTVATIESLLNENDNMESYTKRIRNDAMLSKGSTKQHSMVIGLDPSLEAYKKAYILTEGSYLNPNRTDEVLLPKNYADKLGVKVGDSVDLIAATKDNKEVMVSFIVAGTGQVDRLASFSFYPVYTSLKGSQALTGFRAGEITDIIVYADKGKSAKLSNELQAALSTNGLDSNAVKVSTLSEMGGFLNSIISIYVGILYAFIGILLIIMAILIINLIFMMGLERRSEIGTLRAIGYSRNQIVMIFLGEIFIITTIFFVIGLIIGIALILLLSQLGIPLGAPLDLVLGKVFNIQFDWSQVLMVFMIIYGFALVSSLYPSIKSASVKPAETLREGS